MNYINSVYCLHVATILYSTQHFILKLLMDNKVELTSINFLRFFIATSLNFVQILFNFVKNYNIIEYTSLEKDKVYNVHYMVTCLLLSFFTYTSFFLQLARHMGFTFAKKSSTIQASTVMEFYHPGEVVLHLPFILNNEEVHGGGYQQWFQYKTSNIIRDLFVQPTISQNSNKEIINRIVS